MKLATLLASNVIESAEYGASRPCILLARSSRVIELWVENGADALDEEESENEKMIIAWRKTCRRRVRKIHRLNSSTGEDYFFVLFDDGSWCTLASCGKEVSQGKFERSPYLNSDSRPMQFVSCGIREEQCLLLVAGFSNQGWLALRFNHGILEDNSEKLIYHSWLESVSQNEGPLTCSVLRDPVFFSYPQRTGDIPLVVAFSHPKAFTGYNIYQLRCLQVDYDAGRLVSGPWMVKNVGIDSKVYPTQVVGKTLLCTGKKIILYDEYSAISTICSDTHSAFSHLAPFSCDDKEEMFLMISEPQSYYILKLQSEPDPLMTLRPITISSSSPLAQLNDLHALLCLKPGSYVARGSCELWSLVTVNGSEDNFFITIHPTGIHNANESVVSSFLVRPDEVSGQTVKEVAEKEVALPPRIVMAQAGVIAGRGESSIRVMQESMGMHILGEGDVGLGPQGRSYMLHAIEQKGMDFNLILFTSAVTNSSCVMKVNSAGEAVPVDLLGFRSDVRSLTLGVTERGFLVQVTPREVRVLSPDGNEMLSALGVSKLRAVIAGHQPQFQNASTCMLELALVTSAWVVVTAGNYLYLLTIELDGAIGSTCSSTLFSSISAIAFQPSPWLLVAAVWNSPLLTFHTLKDRKLQGQSVPIVPLNVEDPGQALQIRSLQFLVNSATKDADPLHLDLVAGCGDGRVLLCRIDSIEPPSICLLGIYKIGSQPVRVIPCSKDPVLKNAVYLNSDKDSILFRDETGKVICSAVHTPHGRQRLSIAPLSRLNEGHSTFAWINDMGIITFSSVDSRSMLREERVTIEQTILHMIYCPKLRCFLMATQEVLGGGYHYFLRMFEAESLHETGKAHRIASVCAPTALVNADVLRALGSETSKTTVAMIVPNTHDQINSSPLSSMLVVFELQREETVTISPIGALQLEGPCYGLVVCGGFLVAAVDASLLIINREEASPNRQVFSVISRWRTYMGGCITACNARNGYIIICEAMGCTTLLKLNEEGNPLVIGRDLSRCSMITSVALLQVSNIEEKSDQTMSLVAAAVDVYSRDIKLYILQHSLEGFRTLKVQEQCTFQEAPTQILPHHQGGEKSPEHQIYFVHSSGGMSRLKQGKFPEKREHKTDNISTSLSKNQE